MVILSSNRPARGRTLKRLRAEPAPKIEPTLDTLEPLGVRPAAAWEMIGVSPSTGWKLVRAGEIPVVRIGPNLTIITIGALRDFLARNTVGSPRLIPSRLPARRQRAQTARQGGQRDPVEDVFNERDHQRRLGGSPSGHQNESELLIKNESGRHPLRGRRPPLIVSFGK